MQLHLVFVYGSLRKGESNHWYLESSQFIGAFATEPEFAMYDLGPYPGIVEGSFSVRGEVYQIDDDTLHHLDELEDVPVEYRRETIETPYGEAWVYIYQDASNLNQLVSSGDWCERLI
ncbi:gamma-glutamylcyclotransferase [Vibrio sp.]|uniref:Gamma-glutamylcyclotransferase family protein n=1 Tax=Vibrio viridaestus TaxID=2487322 RepID=A0A3N9U1A2_9VIBR|nr:gamma-glutamylcyclotransferase [Vibrio viridaestus]MDC0611280.1 gamma-glutamylcyclotransferase [Vibrio sp.]RQW61576.1 gamma-glutamylcyclotransferase [Vibrio viridaestus]